MVVPGFQKSLCFWDFMHLGPLGNLKHWRGGVVTDLAESNLLEGVTQEHGMRKLWLDFRQWRKRHKIRPPHGHLTWRTVGRTSKQQWPELHSSYKASTVKLLTVYLGDFLGTLANDS